MRNYFTLNGTSSTAFGVYISGQGTFSSPAREYNLIPVAGRNGDLVGTETRFENGTLKYPAFICNNFATNIENLRAFLNSLFGYKRLTDTYHTGEYREVIFRGPFEPDVLPKNDAGSFELEFECKPQRFLLTGETPTTYVADGTITNPTKFSSRPLIVVTGAGEVGIGSDTITITAADGDTYIDCDMQDAYNANGSRNNFIQLSGHNFPTLKSGSNGITLGTGITKVVITPRWFTI